MWGIRKVVPTHTGIQVIIPTYSLYETKHDKMKVFWSEKTDSGVRIPK